MPKKSYNKRFNRQSNIAFFAKDYKTNPKFLTSLNKITSVDNSVPKTPLRKTRLETQLILQSDQFPSWLENQYCNKTGCFLRSRSMEEFISIFSSLSVEYAIELLGQQAGDYYAIEWLDTSPSSLSKLSQQDPVGYYIYTAHLIVHAGVGNLRDRNTTLQDKILAHKQLTVLIEQSSKNVLKLLYQANQLSRKLLGLQKPSLIAATGFFNTATISSYTESAQGIEKYISEVKDSISSLLANHFRTVKQSRLEQFEKDRRIRYQDLADIRGKNAGWANFHSQPQLKKLSKQDSILYDLLNVLDLDDGYAPGSYQQGISQDLSGTYQSSVISLDDLDFESEDATTDSLDNIEFSNAKTDKTLKLIEGFDIDTDTPTPTTTPSEAVRSSPKPFTSSDKLKLNTALLPNAPQTKLKLNLTGFKK